MPDKAALIIEVFELCNGRRNFSNWLHERADQFADAYSRSDSDKPGLKSHFRQIAEQKVPEWMDVVVEIYSPNVTESELDCAKTELIRLHQTGLLDPPNEALSEQLRETLVKLGLLQIELNRRMHHFLELVIITAKASYQARN